MKLLKPYEQAWSKASFHNRHKVCQLNSQLTDLVRGHALITRRRPKMKAMGSLNPKCKQFIGVKKQEREAREHQELINTLKLQDTEWFEDMITEDEAASYSLAA